MNYRHEYINGRIVVFREDRRFNEDLIIGVRNSMSEVKELIEKDKKIKR